MNSTIEEKAFFSLLATVFSIAFSIALGQLCAGICLVLFICGIAQRRIQIQIPSVLFVAGGFIGLAIVLSFLGGDIHGLWRRCGKLFWFLTLIPVTASLLVQPERARKLLVAFLMGCAVLGLKDLVVYPMMAWRNPVPDFLTSLIDKGSMTDGQMLMVGVVGSTFLASALIRAGQRVPWWGWGLLLAQVLGLLINFKRGSWFCAMILVGIAFVMHLRWRAWCLGLVIIIGVFLLPPVQSRLGQLNREFNVEGGGRLAMWVKIAPELVREHPWGVGYGCLTNDMMRKVFPRVEHNRNHLHSNLIQILVETGWVGLALYLIWMCKSFWDGIVWMARVKGASILERANAAVVTLMLAGLLLNGLVEYNFGDTEIIFIYAILMGMVAAGARLPVRNN
ncbi:MAG: O-antigen ligase family protein [bacterium]